jgi:hypothetical protein
MAFMTAASAPPIRAWLPATAASACRRSASVANPSSTRRLTRSRTARAAESAARVASSSPRARMAEAKRRRVRKRTASSVRLRMASAARLRARDASRPTQRSSRAISQRAPIPAVQSDTASGSLSAAMSKSEGWKRRCRSLVPKTPTGSFVRRAPAVAWTEGKRKPSADSAPSAAAWARSSAAARVRFPSRARASASASVRVRVCAATGPWGAIRANALARRAAGTIL